MMPIHALFRVILLIGYFLLGAFDIACAVVNYKAKRFFRFGVDIMFTFCMMLSLVMLYVK